MYASSSCPASAVISAVSSPAEDMAELNMLLGLPASFATDLLAPDLELGEIISDDDLMSMLSGMSHETLLKMVEDPVPVPAPPRAPVPGPKTPPGSPMKAFSLFGSPGGIGSFVFDGIPPRSILSPSTNRFPTELLDPNRLNNNQLALLAGTAKPALLAVYDPLAGRLYPNSLKSPFKVYPLCPPEYTIGGTGVPYTVVNMHLPQTYLTVIESMDVRRLKVYISISSKLTGRIIRMRHMDKAYVTRRDRTFCSIDEVQVFGKYMQRNYKYGVYSYRIVVSCEFLTTPGAPTPVGHPMPMCWVGQEFDVYGTQVPSAMRVEVQQQVREDLLVLVGVTK